MQSWADPINVRPVCEIFLALIASEDYKVPFVSNTKRINKVEKYPVRIKNHNKTMTAILVAKKMNYRKVKQK